LTTSKEQTMLKVCWINWNLDKKDYQDGRTKAQFVKFMVDIGYEPDMVNEFMKTTVKKRAKS